MEQLEPRLMLAGDSYVNTITPTGNAANPFETLEVDFSKSVDDATLAVADLSIGGSGTPGIGGLTRLSATKYQVDLTGTALDAYVLTVGPAISDTDGTAMNQNRNDTPAEASDAFVGNLLAADLTIADGDATYDGEGIVTYGNTLTVEGDHAFADVGAWGGSTLLANGSTLALIDLTVEEVSSLELAGGSTLNASGTILVTGTSNLLAKGKDISAQVAGAWVGEGVTITAVNVTVDAGSTISADGQGYTTGLGPGGTSAVDAYGEGGTHGGSGSGNTSSTYGDANVPVELGSAGGGKYGGWSRGGGAIWLDVVDTLTVNGQITADGMSENGNHSGGAGGSVMINTGTFAGSGTITADGNDGINGGGGGGHVAVHYSEANTLPGANITALKGRASAENGTIVLNNTPSYRWTQPDDTLFHGPEAIGWASLAVDRNRVTVGVKAFGPGMEISIGTLLTPVDRIAWDRTDVVDGVYELKALFRDDTLRIVDELSRTILVSNSLNWHKSQIDADEPWAAGTVHVVDGNVTVPNGVTVTIEPGAVVKFAEGIGITVHSGGVFDAQATGPLPIVLTSLFDDSAGGDTNLEGSATLPHPGDWAGIGNQGGQINFTDDTSLLYTSTTHGGTLASSEAWTGSLVHRVTSDLDRTQRRHRHGSWHVARRHIANRRCSYRGQERTRRHRGGHLGRLGAGRIGGLHGISHCARWNGRQVPMEGRRQQSWRGVRGNKWQNNTGSQAAPTSLSLPTLTVGTPLMGTFTQVGQEIYYKVVPGAGKDVLISLDRDDARGWTQIYMGAGFMPDTPTCIHPCSI